MVVREAARLGFSARMLRWEGDKPKSGLQAAARAARYRLIGAAMEADGAQVLLSAHHRQDQAETVLMRMAHGSGLHGLGGMRDFAEVEGVRIFRPLLGLDKADLMAVVAEAGMTPVDDPSNANSDFERVRWRQMLPALADMGLDAGRLGQFSERAARADLALTRMAAEAFEQIVAVDALGIVRFERADFAVLDAEIGIRVLGHGLALAGAHSRPFALGPVERLYDDIIHGRPLGKTLCGAMVQAKGPTVSILREAKRMHQEDMVLRAGTRMVWDRRFEIYARGDDLTIRSGSGLTRARLEVLFAAPFLAPVIGAHGAPMVMDTGGQVLALGGHLLAPAMSERVQVRVFNLTRE